MSIARANINCGPVLSKTAKKQSYWRATCPSSARPSPPAPMRQRTLLAGAQTSVRQPFKSSPSFLGSQCWKADSQSRFPPVYLTHRDLPEIGHRPKCSQISRFTEGPNVLGGALPAECQSFGGIKLVIDHFRIVPHPRGAWPRDRCWCVVRRVARR